MANLGGKITLDISELQSKIVIANKAIKSNEAAWRESAAQLDDWTKSEEALKSKLDVSNEKIKTQRDIVSMLTEKKKLLIEQYGAESKQVEKVNSDIIKYSKALDTSQKENDAIRKSLEKLTAEQDDEKKAVNDATKAVKDNTTATDKNETAQKDLLKAVSKASGGFTVLKGVVANLTTSLIKGTLSALKSITSSIMTLPDATRELRKELSLIETAFKEVGFTETTAREAWLSYNAVLGAVDSNASNTLTLLGGLTKESKDLTEWTIALTGVYATLGSAYPTAELVKNIAETSRAGKMTENLNKVLQAVGVNTEKFSTRLTNLKTVEERSAYILSVLNKEYGEAGKNYYYNNKQIIEAEKSQLKLNTAWTKLGNAAEPVKTAITNALADVITAFSGLTDGTSTLDELEYNIGYFAGTVVREFKVIYDLFEPYIIELKDKIIAWFDKNKDELKNKVKTWLTDIFGADMVKQVQGMADTIVKPIVTFFNKLSKGDYMGALGVALPVITIGIGLTLAQSTIAALPNLIISGIKGGLTSSGVTVGSAIAGTIGVISLGLAVKDALAAESGGWKKFGTNLVTALIAGLAAAGLTGSLNAGVIVASLVLQTKIGDKVEEVAKEVGTTVTQKMTGEYKQTKEINDKLGTTKTTNAKAIADEVQDAVKAADIVISKSATKSITVPVQFKWEGSKDVQESLRKEIDGLLKQTYLKVGKVGAKADISNILTNASEGGKEIAKAIIEGFGFEIEDLGQISELQAMAILNSMKDVLGIHSPSKEAEKLGTYFVQGWTAGLEGLPNATAAAVNNALTAATDEIDEGTKTAGESAKNVLSGIGDALLWIVEKTRDGITLMLEGYDKESGAEGVYDTLYDKGVSWLTKKGGWWGFVGQILRQVRNAMKSDENTEKYLEEIVNDMVEGFMNLLNDLPTIVKYALKFLKAILQGLAEALPEILKELPNIIAEIIEVIISMIPDFIEVGWELIKGLAKGMWEGLKSIGRNIKDWCSNLVDNIKDFFGIASPSKVFKNEVGKNIAAGIGVGIEEGIPKINAALDDVNTKLNMRVASSDTTSIGSGDKIVNVYQTNTYSKAYSAYELYKSERNIRRLVGAY